MPCLWAYGLWAACCAAGGVCFCRAVAGLSVIFCRRWGRVLQFSMVDVGCWLLCGFTGSDGLDQTSLSVLITICIILGIKTAISVENPLLPVQVKCLGPAATDFRLGRHGVRQTGHGQHRRKTISHIHTINNSLAIVSNDPILQSFLISKRLHL